MNALFALHKPQGMSSHSFLTKMKKKYKWKKCGYSGTLDPFASGLLVVGVGAYTRLFDYLKKGVKTYEATLWLGAKSASLDIDHIDEVQCVEEFSKEKIIKILQSFRRKISYIPPKFSAKHINGKRAYQLARDGVEFELLPCEMEVFEIELLFYSHPFVHFRVSVSEGGYIRSLGEMIAKELQCNGSLSSLRRIKEGNITLPKEIKQLDVLSHLDLERIDLSEYQEEILQGKKIILKGLEKHKRYLVVFEEFFSIIGINEKEEIKYFLNRIPKC